METLAYLHVDQENSEQELTPEALNALKLSGKFAGTLVGAAGVAIAVGAINSPAQANGYYGGGYGCYDYCSDVSYLGGGYQVTSYQTYDVSYDSCYDYCGTSYHGGGYDGGCYDYCGVSYGGYGGGYYGGGYGGGCYDYCGVSYYGGGYGGGCYDYCGVSYGGYGGGGCYDYCGVSYGYSTYDIQMALSYAGFYVSVDGVYGPETSSAIVAFQHAVGLVPDGVVGPATASALGLY